MFINQNAALFTVLGTTYGGNGVTTFDLPNLQGQSVVGLGSDGQSTPDSLGQAYGNAGITLTPQNITDANLTLSISSPGTITAASGPQTITFTFGTQPFGFTSSSITAAGGTMSDVTQVLVYLTRQQDFSGMNAVYRRFFERPFPNRATVVVAGLMAPGAVIEIVAYAHLKH